MNNYLKFIEDEIKKKLNVKKIKVIDNSFKHKSHKFFDIDKYHLCLEIESKYLKSLDKLTAQRSILNILKKEMKSKIHALEIKIK